MDMKKLAAAAATAGLLGLGGAAAAHADPHTPPPSPSGPGNSDHNANPGNGSPTQWPATITGPGVNAGAPGNPLPPGQGFLPPPGHGGPMPQDRIPFPSTPSWVTMPVLPPLGAPPQPTLPDWATGLPVFWDPDLAAWGVWDAQTGTFVRI